MNQTEMFNLIEKFTGQKNIIAIPRIFIGITDNLSSALMLSQLIYWSGRIKSTKGYIYKTAKEFSEELGVSESTIRRAKTSLEKSNLITTKIHRANGTPTTHYKINSDTLMDMLNGTSPSVHNEQVQMVNMNKSITETTTETTNSLFPKGNKVSPSDETKPFLSDEIAETWHEGEDLNRFWKYTVGKGSHKSLESKFLVSGKYGGVDRKTLPVWAPITSAIRTVGLSALKKAIIFYKETQDTDEYMLGSTWTLAEFCHGQNYAGYMEGVPKKKFASKDPWDAIRAEFQPLTSICSQVFDEKTKRYYGFQLHKINSEIRWEDTKELMQYTKDEGDCWTFNHFMELEWMIAGMLWRRKKEGHNLEVCKEYMEKWKELIPQFKKRARTWLKEDWELYG